MAELFANGARGNLAVAIGAGDTSATLEAGAGATYPAFGVGDFAWVTLENGPAENPTEREIVRCTARAGDVLTIVRAQQGTVAQSFPAETTRVELRLTAETLASLQAALGLSRRYLVGGIIPTSAAFVQFGSLTSISSSGFVSVAPTATSRGTASNRRTSAAVNNIRMNGTAASDATVLGLCGSAPRKGGFELVTRFLVQLDEGAAAKFFGVAASTSNDLLPVATDPSDLTTTPLVGVGQQRATPTGLLGGTWQLYHSDGGGAVTQVDTGIQKVIDNLLQLRVWSIRGRPTFFVELIDFDAQTRFFTELATNIPGSNSPMQLAYCSRSNGVISDGFGVCGVWHYQW